MPPIQAVAMRQNCMPSGKASGDLSIALTTTVSPVIMPGLFHYMRTKHSAIQLRVEEMISATIIDKVKKAEIDMGILTYPVNDPDLLEIPLYHERFFCLCLTQR